MYVYIYIYISLLYGVDVRVYTRMYRHSCTGSLVWCLSIYDEVKDTWFLMHVVVEHTFMCWCYFLLLRSIPFGHLACVHTIQRNTTSAGISAKLRCVWDSHGFLSVTLQPVCSRRIVCSSSKPQSFNIEMLTTDFIIRRMTKWRPLFCPFAFSHWWKTIQSIQFDWKFAFQLKMIAINFEFFQSFLLRTIFLWWLHTPSFGF